MKHQFSFSIFYPDFSDPQLFLEAFQTNDPNNRTNFSNSEYDDLIKEISTEEDNQKRFDMMYEAESMVMDEMPVLPLFYGSRVYMKQPYVSEIIFHPSAIIDYKYTEIQPE